MDFKQKVFATVAGVALLGTFAYLYNKRREEKNKESDVVNNNKISLIDFHLDTQKLRELVSHFQNEMNLGLNDSKAISLKMLPSFVGKPSGTEKGTFYALDLGGTNFRVISVPLNGNKQVNLAQCKKKQFAIPPEAMNGTAEHLFDFIAESVGSFVAENHSQQAPVVLGFTFSFPVNQLSINSGTLIKWTKGFKTQGVEGKDVVMLLEEAFQRKKIGAKIVALANDTVGTMMASSYSNPDCEMGVILGTGTNACYIEKLSHMQKFRKAHDNSSFRDDNMIINMEWGAFGDAKNILPLTAADKQLDAESVNPRAQLFEKMISGMYLGEIARLLMIEAINSGKLLLDSAGVKQSSIYTSNSFQTSYLSDILGDTNSEFPVCKTILEKHFGILNSSVLDRQAIYDTCLAVSERAARLSAATIYAVLSKIGRTQNVKVAVDGSVFEHIPGFRTTMKATLNELDSKNTIDLILSKDGSGIGAAIIAATVHGKSSL